MTMPDANTAAERAHDAEQSRRERYLDQAEPKRARLVASYIADERGKHELALLDCLAELAGGDSEFLHALQRIVAIAVAPSNTPQDITAIMVAAGRMSGLFHAAIDHAIGDELVEAEAAAIEDDKPC